MKTIFAYLLSGRLRRSGRGAAMCGFSASRTFKRGREWRKRCYICGKRNTTIDGCRALLGPARAVADHSVRRQTIVRDITRTERAIKDLVELVGQGIAVAEVGRRLRAREVELRDLQRQQAELGALPALLSATPEAAVAFAQTLSDRLHRRRFRPALGAAPGDRQSQLRPRFTARLQVAGGIGMCLLAVVAMEYHAWTTRHHHHFS